MSSREEAKADHMYMCSHPDNSVITVCCLTRRLGVCVCGEYLNGAYTRACTFGLGVNLRTWIYIHVFMS